MIYKISWLAVIFGVSLAEEARDGLPVYYAPKVHDYHHEPQADQREPHAYQHKESYSPAQYSFGYVVQQPSQQLDFGHSEKRDGSVTSGSYHVRLPDGRLQTVTYTVDGDSGYVAKVSYDDEPAYPDPHPKPDPVDHYAKPVSKPVVSHSYVKPVPKPVVSHSYVKPAVSHSYSSSHHYDSKDPDVVKEKPVKVHHAPYHPHAPYHAARPPYHASHHTPYRAPQRAPYHVPQQAPHHGPYFTPYQNRYPMIYSPYSSNGYFAPLGGHAAREETAATLQDDVTDDDVTDVDKGATEE